MNVRIAILVCGLLSFFLIFCNKREESAQSSDFPSKVKPGKPTKIILMIGDGMGTAQIFAGLTANKGKLNIERFTAIGFHKSQSADQYVTDSGAGATAFSTGAKTNNGSIGLDATGVVKPTILEIAESYNFATGMVTTCSITHATPASFIAHQSSRTLGEDIANDFLKTDIDVFIGGGKNHFAQRKDGKNLLDSLRKRSYQVVESITEITKISSGKLAGFTADAEPIRMLDGRGPQLVQNTQTAINILNKNPKGFFLMVEGSQIDWGSHANDAAYLTSELIDFDKAVGAALDFAQRDGNTLVIVTGDHETGGLTLTNGDIKAGTLEAKFTTNGHTGVMIPVFAYGPGAESFIGIYENASIFDKMLGAFGFKR
ncbi:alkaline phosphatase [Flavitalea sp.]|nr:alkaline phosphatase [Flavitalea sp.]